MSQKTAQSIKETPDIGTEIRIVRGEVEVINGKARVRGDALRIDQLRSRGVIDDMQHFECMKLRTFWIGANCQPYKAIQYEPRITTQRLNTLADSMSERLSNRERYFFLMQNIHIHHAKLLYAVVLEEKALRDAVRDLGLMRRNGNEKQLLHHAIDDLQEARDKLWDYENPQQKTV